MKISFQLYIFVRTLDLSASVDWYSALADAIERGGLDGIASYYYANYTCLRSSSK